MSAQEILKASVMAEVDVVSRPLTKLLESAKEHASSFTALVPSALYLPAPPLYCPQPAPNTQVLHVYALAFNASLMWLHAGTHQPSQTFS